MGYSDPTNTRATLYTVTAANWNEAMSAIRALRGAATNLIPGIGYDASVTTFNADGQDFDSTSRVFIDQATGDNEGTIQMRVVMTAQITALNSATSITFKAQAFVEAASASTGNVNTTIPIYTPAAVTTTGFKSFDSGWVSIASLLTDISGYGFAVLRPRYRVDYVTGAGPSIFHVTSSIALRVT